MFRRLTRGVEVARQCMTVVYHGASIVTYQSTEDSQFSHRLKSEMVRYISNI